MASRRRRKRCARLSGARARDPPCLRTDHKNFGSFSRNYLRRPGRDELDRTRDVLESGIDVIAHRPQATANILLLSGGEKAMAALALVLGIFHYRPSPFCLLDEVDARLTSKRGAVTDKVAPMSARRSSLSYA